MYTIKRDISVAECKKILNEYAMHLRYTFMMNNAYNQGNELYTRTQFYKYDKNDNIIASWASDFMHPSNGDSWYSFIVSYKDDICITVYENSTELIINRPEILSI